MPHRWLKQQTHTRYGFKGDDPLYEPVDYWWDDMVKWIKSRSYADCHKWIDKHDNELVVECSNFFNSLLTIVKYTVTPSCFLLFE